MKRYEAIVLVIVAVFGYASLSTADYRDAENQYESYCTNVTLWERNKHVDTLDRAGHPDYLGLNVCND